MTNKRFHGAVRDLAGRVAGRLRGRPVRTFEPSRIIVPQTTAAAPTARPTGPRPPLYVVTD